MQLTVLEQKTEAGEEINREEEVSKQANGKRSYVEEYWDRIQESRRTAKSPSEHLGKVADIMMEAVFKKHTIYNFTCYPGTLIKEKMGLVVFHATVESELAEELAKRLYAGHGELSSGTWLCEQCRQVQ
jgi:hypothetical protein